MNDGMPFKDPEKEKQYQKEYYQKHKQKKIEYAKIQGNKYKQTPAGRKGSCIRQWKSRGVIHNDFDELYEKYINTELCESCNCILTTDKKTTSTRKCLDHCHDSGLFRNVICNGCNVKRR